MRRAAVVAAAMLAFAVPAVSQAAVDTNVKEPAIPRPDLPYTRLPVQGTGGPPVLYDMNGDGKLDIIQTGWDGFIHVWTLPSRTWAAAARAVARIAERHRDDPVWVELAGRWTAIETSGKEAALIDLIGRNPQEKKIVFVHARETLTHVAGRLEQAGVAFARFDGSMSGPEKDAAIAAFRDQASVLLCTQSGGEGRNIQF